jgi:hypothetical protein
VHAGLEIDVMLHSTLLQESEFAVGDLPESPEKNSRQPRIEMTGTVRYSPAFFPPFARQTAVLPIAPFRMRAESLAADA